MTEWNLKVPKILHVYWGGGKLVYLRYLTITSFIRLNPDWEVCFWYPTTPFTGKSWGIEPGYQEFDNNLCDDYFSEIMKLPIKKIAVDFETMGFGKDSAEVHKADYIRIRSLFLQGGAWADMDILFFKSMNDLFVNIPANYEKETFVCMCDYGHSTGFVMARERSKFFGILLNFVKDEYPKNSYQCIGPDMFNKYFPTLESINKISPAVNIGMNVVYAHDAYHQQEILDGTKPRFTDESIGIHWYGGHSMWGGFFNETRGGTINLPDNIIGNLLKNEK
jgi:hypothetical protein